MILFSQYIIFIFIDSIMSVDSGRIIRITDGTLIWGSNFFVSFCDIVHRRYWWLDMFPAFNINLLFYDVFS